MNKKQKKLEELGLDIKIDDLIKTSETEEVKETDKKRKSEECVDKMLESFNDSLKEKINEPETCKNTKKSKKVKK